MSQRTPVERAVATYRGDWAKIQVNSPEYARVNLETLAEKTDPDFCFRYIDISSVDTGFINWETVLTIRFGDAPSRARRVVRTGDLLICTVRPLLGSHAYADWTHDFLTVCSTGFAVIRPSAGLIPGFLKHLPFAEQVTRQMVAWQCGTNYPAVNERDIRKLTIPAPSKDEQAAIARILDAVDAAIDRARQALSLAREAERTLIADAFDRLGAQSRKLGEFSTDVRYGTSQASSERGWGNPVLRIPNVVSDQLTLDDVAHVDLRPVEVDRLALSDGDLLLVRTNGNPNYVGRSAVFRRPDDRTWVYASYLIRIRLVGELVPDYVNVFLSSERGRRELLRRVTTSAGNHNINSNSIRLLSIPVPRHIETQNEMVRLAAASRQVAIAFKGKLLALKMLKKSLMHDLLTGTIRVNSALFQSEAAA